LACGKCAPVTSARRADGRGVLDPELDRAHGDGLWVSLVEGFADHGYCRRLSRTDELKEQIE
jgi:hypothetical protein